MNKNWDFDKDRPLGLCAPSPTVPLQPPFPEAIRLYGSKNVEQALIFITNISHPVTGLAINLPYDDESVSDALAAAFSALKREELNSEGIEEKLADAIQTCLYTLKLPVILNTDGSMTVYDYEDGTPLFEGSNWDFVQWMRERETVLIEPDLDPGMGPDVRKEVEQT